MRTRTTSTSISAPLASAHLRLMHFLHEGREGGFRGLSFPTYVARQGWRVTVNLEGHPLLWLGRDTSSLTGHVHIEWSALPKLAHVL